MSFKEYAILKTLKSGRNDGCRKSDVVDHGLLHNIVLPLRPETNNAE